MVACKTIGEYRRNQEKIKKFFLKEAKQAKKSSTSAPMRSHPTTNESQEIPGPSRTPSQPTTSAPKRTRSDLESSNKPKKRNFKKEPINTKWSKKSNKTSNKKPKGATTLKRKQKAKEQTEHSSSKL